ncbi:MAG: T9SS type A sorting domain-containing protein [Bacteroidales bacterium]|nr:T9SS type A sorting domain-containing protein [Bacteroidales bacterium]
MKKRTLLLGALSTMMSVAFADLPTPVVHYPLQTDLKPTSGTKVGIGHNIDYEQDDYWGTKVLTFYGGTAEAEGQTNEDASWVDLDPTFYKYDAVTVNIWFNCTTVDGWTRIFTFATDDAYTTKSEVFLSPSDGRTGWTPAFFCNPGTSEFPDQAGDKDAGALEPAVAGQWYMATCMQDADSIYFYLNGVRQSALYVGVKPSAMTFESFWLGKSGWQDAFFNGKMKDLKIFSQTLTPSQVMELYNSSKPVGVKNIASSNITLKNTAKGFVLNMSNPSNTIAEVYNIQGVKIMTKKVVSQSTAFDNLKPGVYVVAVSVDQQKSVFKVVVR